MTICLEELVSDSFVNCTRRYNKKAHFIPVLNDWVFMQPKDKKALTNWVRPLVTFTGHLTAELQNDFVEDLVNEMLLNDPPLKNQTIPLSQVKIEVIIKQY